jgi:gamma-glutamyltranspeptidase
MGGDAFWLIHDAHTGKVRYLNGGGRAAASADPAFFKSKGLSEVPFSRHLASHVDHPRGCRQLVRRAHRLWQVSHAPHLGLGHGLCP